jgi:hypothetical protein
MENGHFSPDVEEFLLALHRHQVRYLIVGGEAVIFYGYPRLTGDLDLYFDGSKENTQRLYEALEEFWGGSVPGVNDESELRVVGVVAQFGVPPNRVDLMNQIDGVSFPEAWKGRTVDFAVLGGERIPLAVIGVRELIRNKEAMARYRDLDDLKYLRQSGGQEES